MSAEGASGSEELRLSLFDHLRELRSRLFRITVAVLVLGAISLSFSRELFHVLVLPILQALPEGERALVQTSAVEELNTFLKVGLYAGLFFSAPVILHQIWGFVSPGLYANERRLAAPFILAGTACFVAGAAFCYFVVLPPAFGFLLQPNTTADQRAQLLLAEGRVDDAGRFLRAGATERAQEALRAGEELLSDLGGDASGSQALAMRIEELGSMLDAAAAAADSPEARASVVTAIAARAEARESLLNGDGSKANEALRRAGEALGAAWEGKGARNAALWQRQLELQAHLAGATERLDLAEWTRPMLSMREQLNLVLILLLAFGFIFEIPVVFSLLAALGVVTGDGLAKFRRYAIVVNVIVAAVITPTGDPLNLALMAVPMVLCYEIGVLAAKIISRRRQAREAAYLAS